MGYFYATEKGKFKAEFKRFQQKAIAAEMSEEDTQVMYETDLHQFNRDRAFFTRTQPIDGGDHFSDGDEADEDQSPLFEKYLEALSVPLGELFANDRYGWIENLEDERFTGISSILSPEDIEAMAYIAKDGLSQTEIALELSLSRAAICKRLKRIREKLEKYHLAD
ncbi:MAG: ECF-type sigma factor [Candidatus Saccharimonadales bacterium]